jgi:hypothetical protein
MVGFWSFEFKIFRPFPLLFSLLTFPLLRLCNIQKSIAYFPVCLEMKVGLQGVACKPEGSPRLSQRHREEETGSWLLSRVVMELSA